MNKELIEELKAQDFNVVAVSKTRTKEEIDEVAKMGLTTFGENRVQEFIDKYDPKYTWHIIGHLQTNKVKYIIGKVDVIESLDSLKLAEEIEKQANKHDIIQKVLVEGESKNNKEMLSGRTDSNKVVIFEGTKELKDKIVDIKIVSQHMWYLKGELK